PAASEDVPSRSRLRRIAAEKGEPAPRFDASEDGLLRWLDAQCADADANPRFAELRELIRRLAASGQGVEAIKTLATGSNSVEVYGPGNHGGRADWLVAVRDNNTDNANEYEGETLEAALSAAATPTQEKGNG